MRSSTSILALAVASALVAALAAPPTLAQTDEEEPVTAAPVDLDGWLQLGPVAVPLPAFHDRGSKRFGAADLLALPVLEVDELWPEAGDELRWSTGETLRWRRVEPSPELLVVDAERPAVAYLGVYLEAERFATAKLEIDSPHPLRVYLDGEQVAERAKSAGGGAEDEAAEGTPEPAIEPLSAELPLTRGKHLLLLALVRDPEAPAQWSVAGRIEAPAGTLGTSTEPARTLRLADVLDVPGVNEVAVSADGEHVAIALGEPAAPSEDGDRWIEIRSRRGELRATLHGGEQGFEWAPSGTSYAYLKREGETSEVWLAELGGGSRRVLEGGKELRGFSFLPDGEGLIYALSAESEKDERGVKRYRGLNDRWDGWRDLVSLFHLSFADGTRRRLTAGAESVRFHDVRPDGGALLFSTEAYNPTEWPFSHSDLFELDLATLAARRLQRVTWFGSAAYSPDGERIAITAGPSGFGDEGRAEAAPPGALNEYDAQLYLLDRATLAVDPVSRGFDPSVLGAAWTESGDLVVHAQQGDRARLYRLRAGERRFEPLDTGLDLVEGWSLARATGEVAYFGSSTRLPQRVMLHPGKPGAEPATVLEPAAADLADLELGRVEDWSFESSDGATISGRVHYPPDFDRERSYPLIVYYYGGALPTDRAFGGRYPKDVWAANGYVVYVLQPSGATGFGQEFSARHVNDWGERVTREIIEGTERFLAAHPFVDRERVGSIGASYGGFTTLLLQTRTDLFSAAVAHAGISSISSYWGQGWWGYLYNAVAGANSYPWNNPDLYVGRSPLFQADKIDTPLLLLHGDADTNVPPGESQQIYTALEVLGKEVELLTFEGENHRIIDRDKRELWSRSIIAWFDRWLKDEPEYWQHLMGSDDEPKG